MSDLQNKVIQVASKEEKAGPFGPMVKIKDQDGKTYTVFKNKKDGTTSVAWEQMPAVGDTVQIGYAEEDGEYEGKPFKRRTARSFNSDIGNGVTNTQSTRTEPLNASGGKQDETFWDKKAYKQCLWNYWLKRFNPLVGIDNGVHSNLLGETEMDMVYQVFNQIEKDAEERFSKPKGWAELGAKLKTEAEEVGGKGIHLTTDPEEVDGDDLPF